MKLKRNKSLELFDDLVPSIKYSQVNYRLTNLIGLNSFDRFYKKLKESTQIKLRNDLSEFFDEKSYKFYRKGPYKAFNMDEYIKSRKEEDKKEERKLSLKKKKIHIYLNERTIENVQKIRERIEKMKNESPFCKYNPKYDYVSKRIPNVYIVPEHISHSVSKSNITNNNYDNALTGKTKYQLKNTNENNLMSLRKITFQTSRYPNSPNVKAENKNKFFSNYKIIKKGTLEETKTIQKSSSLPMLTLLNKTQHQTFKINCLKCSNSVNKSHCDSIEEKLMTPVNQKYSNCYSIINNNNNYKNIVKNNICPSRNNESVVFPCVSYYKEKSF